MKDIFGKELSDYCIVTFPFITRGSYMNSKTTVELSYGVMKGKRVYTMRQGKLVYKIINSPERMVYLLNEVPEDVFETIREIRRMLDSE